MKQRKSGNILASRQWGGRTWYAAQVPGDGGVDWGYTNSPKEALLLNHFFARRFNANAKYCDGKPANMVSLGPVINGIVA